MYRKFKSIAFGDNRTRKNALQGIDNYRSALERRQKREEESCSV